MDDIAMPSERSIRAATGNDSVVAQRDGPDNMVWIPGGEFVMGSDEHYPEEAPKHRVIVNGFWMDTHTVTNREFRRFVDATGYVTLAERPADPKDYPDAKPELLAPASVVFRKSAGRWTWAIPTIGGPTSGARIGDIPGAPNVTRSLGDHPVVHVAFEDALAYVAMGRQRVANRSRMGIRRAWRSRWRRVRVGR